MPNYVYDDTVLFFPKTNLTPLPPGADPTQHVQSIDWNTLNQAVDDIKGVLRGAQFYGVEKQAVDPSPAGIADYLWSNTSGDLFFHTGGGDVLLTPAAATVTGAVNIGAGAGSIGPFKQLSGGNLEFKGIRPASNKITVVDSVGTDDVDLDVVEANLIHQSLSGAGAADHAAIDLYLPSSVQKTDLGQLDGALQGTVWFSNVAGRVTRLAPGTAGQSLITAGAALDPAWGDALLTFQDEGGGVANTPHSILNFVGAGVNVTDGGGGVATVTISGAGAGNSLDEAYNINPAITVDGAAVSLTNDAANSNNVLEISKTPGGINGGSCLVATMEDIATGWAAQFFHPGIGNTAAPTKGILLSNTTPATTGATNEEYSPTLAFVGNAHDTANSRIWTWGLQNQPVNAAADESHLHFLVDDHGNGFVSMANLDQVGELTLAAGLTLGSGVSITSAGDVAFAVGDLDLQTAVTTLDIKGGVALSVDGVALTTGLTAALLSEALLFFTNTGLTGAEAETLTDGSNADALHVHATVAHTIASHSDTTATGTELETLTDGSNADALHVHAVPAHTIASHSDTSATGAELDTLTDTSNADSLHAHSALAATSAAISIVTTTSGDVDITSAGAVDIDGTAIQINGTGDMNFTSTQAAAATALLMNIFADNNAATSGDTDLNIDANSLNGTARVNVNADAGGEVNIASDAVTQKVNIGNATVAEVNINGALMGIFGATAVAQQASGADLTNSVTSGGTNDTIADFTDLSTYATDAAAIRNAIYQLARKLKQVNDGMRAYGLLT